MTAVAVCGFGRCGTSMLMRMLDAGGIPAVAGSGRRGYELPTSDMFPALDQATVEGHAVKLLDAVLYDLWPAAQVAWRILWLDRDPREQGRSQVKLLNHIGMRLEPGTARKFADSYRRDRPVVLAALRDRGQVLEMTYEGALRFPTQTALQVRDFLAPDLELDTEAAASVVHRRRPYCAPDLAFELGQHSTPAVTS